MGDKFRAGWVSRLSPSPTLMGEGTLEQSGCHLLGSCPGAPGCSDFCDQLPTLSSCKQAPHPCVGREHLGGQEVALLGQSLRPTPGGWLKDSVQGGRDGWRLGPETLWPPCIHRVLRAHECLPAHTCAHTPGLYTHAHRHVGPQESVCLFLCGLGLHLEVQAGSSSSPSLTRWS